VTHRMLAEREAQIDTDEDGALSWSLMPHRIVLLAGPEGNPFKLKTHLRRSITTNMRKLNFYQCYRGAQIFHKCHAANEIYYNKL
jgi:hypothetical protein